MTVEIRPLGPDDCDAALTLYTELTLGPPATNREAFDRVLVHEGTTLLGAHAGTTLAGMVTLHILPNVTWDARPYALIENVITSAPYRKQGIGKALLHAAAERAWDADCFKIMLMTGNKRGAQGFYEAAGFSSEDKTAMVLRET